MSLLSWGMIIPMILFGVIRFLSKIGDYLAVFDKKMHYLIGQGKEERLKEILRSWCTYATTDPLAPFNKEFKINFKTITLIDNKQEYTIKKIYPKDLDDFKAQLKILVPEMFLWILKN